MHVSIWLANDTPSIQSTRRLKAFSLGLLLNKKAEAPSDNIHLKNSLSKLIKGLSFNSCNLCASSSKAFATREPENLSEPVATAFSTSPVLTAIYAYLKACIPAQQTPDGETTSIGLVSGK